MSHFLSIEDYNQSEKTLETWARATLAANSSWSDPEVVARNSVAVEILSNPTYRKQQVRITNHA
jgi:hypothetical protein